MSSKLVKFGAEARSQLQIGVNTVADAVKISLGPRGRNAAIERPGGTPLITKDGVSIAKSISLKDPLQNIGCTMIKSVAASTNAIVGDGSTSVTILSQAIFNEGIKLIAAGNNPVLLKRGLDLGLVEVFGFLTSLAQKIDSEDMLKHVATISSNNDKSLGNMIGEVISNVGDNGLVSIEEATGSTDSVSYTEGLQIGKGMVSPAFVTNLEKLNCELLDSYVVLYDDKISQTSDFIDIIQKVHATGKPIFIIARDIEQDALATLLINREKAHLKCCAIKSPGFGDTRRDILDDIAAVVGGKVFDNQNKRALRDAELEDLGTARRIVCNRNSTMILDGGGTRECVESRIGLLKAQMSDSMIFDHQKTTLKERLTKLAGGAAIIRVGGSTESEMRERKDRIEDSVNAVRAAIEMGVVPGGGSALLQASKVIGDFIISKRDSELLPEEMAGLLILKNALKEPFLQIMNNAGFEHHGPQEKILSLGGFAGFDALRGIFVEDMMKGGIIDPAKVVRKGVEHAVSAAGTLLTTEVCIFTDLSEFAEE